VFTLSLTIAHGRILADGTPAGLAQRSPHHNAVRLGVAAGDLAQIRGELLRLPAVKAVDRVADGEGEGLVVLPRGSEPIVADIADLARAHRWDIALLRVERGRLDEVFRAITAPAAAPQTHPQTLPPDGGGNGRG
jgi:ABC-2 type transport system ATP-binding protein